MYEEMRRYFTIYCMRRPLVICDFAPDPSEFPYIWGKFYFLFYQCSLGWRWPYHCGDPDVICPAWQWIRRLASAWCLGSWQMLCWCLPLDFQPINFIRVTTCIYPTSVPHNINRGHYRYLPCKIYCLVFGLYQTIIFIRPLSFCNDITNICIREQLCKFTDFSQ